MKVSSILWLGRQVSRLPQKTCDDQTSLVGCFLRFWWKPPIAIQCDHPHGYRTSQSTPTSHPHSQEPRQPSSSKRASPSLSPSHTLERHRSERHPLYSPPQDHNRPTSPLFDDRYSRSSMASKMLMSSRFSVNAVSGVEPGEIERNDESVVFSSLVHDGCSFVPCFHL